MSIAPTDIFDRNEGWGHSATTNYSAAAQANVSVASSKRDDGSWTSALDRTPPSSDYQHIKDDRNEGWGHTATTNFVASIRDTVNVAAGIRDDASWATAVNAAATNHAHGPAFGGVVGDRTSGYGHTKGSTQNVKMNSATNNVTVAAQHD